MKADADWKWGAGSFCLEEKFCLICVLEKRCSF